METRAPYGKAVSVPPEYWDQLVEKNIQKLGPRAVVMSDAERGILVMAFNEQVRVDLDKREIQKGHQNGWRRAKDPFLELLLLVYLNNVTAQPFMNEMVGAQDLRDAQFFQGPHALETGDLIETFGSSPAQLFEAGARLGGTRLS